MNAGPREESRHKRYSGKTPVATNGVLYRATVMTCCFVCACVRACFFVCVSSSFSFFLLFTFSLFFFFLSIFRTACTDRKSVYNHETVPSIFVHSFRFLAQRSVAEEHSSLSFPDCLVLAHLVRARTHASACSNICSLISGIVIVACQGWRYLYS